jgi:hypothetical protein
MFLNLLDMFLKNIWLILKVDALRVNTANKKKQKFTGPGGPVNF